MLTKKQFPGEQCLLTILFLSFVLVSIKADEVSWKKDQNAGIQYQRQGNYAEAVKAYLAALVEAEKF